MTKLWDPTTRASYDVSVVLVGNKSQYYKGIYLSICVIELCHGCCRESGYDYAYFGTKSLSKQVQGGGWQFALFSYFPIS